VSDSEAKAKLLGDRYARIEKRLIPFLEPLVRDALARGVHPPRYDGELEEAQNYLFMLTKDDPLRKEVAEYEAQKAAGRTLSPYHGVQMGWYPEHCLKGAASSLANMFWSVYINRLTSILRPGMNVWGDGRVITAPHLRFYQDPACVDGDMLPLGLDVREIDDHFWHTVLTADDVRSALRAYKATLPTGTVIDADLALILDDFLAEVEHTTPNGC
jgi:hypothetical protein